MLQQHVQPAIANGLGALSSSLDESTVSEALQDVVMRHQLSNEITVTVKILHSHNVDLPVNESQERCLNELRIELKKLGVREGVWQAPKVVAH